MGYSQPQAAILANYQVAPAAAQFAANHHYGAPIYPPPQHAFYPAPSHVAGATGSTWNSPPPASRSTSPVARQPTSVAPQSHLCRHNSAPPTSIRSDTAFDGNGDPLPALEFDEFDFDGFEGDFESDCYFSRHPHQINPDLTIGVIAWKAPRPGVRALPPTFALAELEDIAPRKPLPSDTESVSDYFIFAKRDEALLSVRQTDVWHEVKHDLIYKEFTRFCRDFLSIPELKTLYRGRRDSSWEESDRASVRSVTPSISRPQSRHSNDVDIDDRRSISSWRNSEEPQPHNSHQVNGHQHRSASQHSRATSITSQSSNRPKVTRPRPLPMVRDQAQEDILAALGVTGSPKLVYETPGPAFGPPPATTVQSKKSNSRTSSVSSTHSSISTSHAWTKFPPAPATNLLPNGRRSPVHEMNPTSQPFIWSHDRPSSSHCHMAPIGSDFSPKNDVTPRPAKVFDLGNRKRSYADSVHGPWSGGEGLEDVEEEDEATPKPRKQVRVQQ